MRQLTSKNRTDTVNSSFAPSSSDFLLYIEINRFSNFRKYGNALINRSRFSVTSGRTFFKSMIYDLNQGMNELERGMMSH